MNDGMHHDSGVAQLQHAFLPVNGLRWLCRIYGSAVLPRAAAPAEGDARRWLSRDGDEFAVLDQGGKRVGQDRLLRQAPWFEPVRPSATLTKDWVAHAALVHRGILLAGGHSAQGEALWLRQPGRQPDWTAVALPEGLGRRGKAIDVLIVRGQELVAIDNILLPKWVLVYPLERTLDAAGEQKLRLKSHSTYETIRHPAEGPDVYVLLSHGYNHGNSSSHLSVVRKDDFREIGCWSGTMESSTQQLVDEAQWDLEMADAFLLSDVDQIPAIDLVNATLKAWSRRQRYTRSSHGSVQAEITDMGFCDSALVLALGSHGLAITTPPAARVDSDGIYSGSQHSMRAVMLERLAAVHQLHCILVRIPVCMPSVPTAMRGPRTNGFQVPDCTERRWLGLTSPDSLRKFAGK